MFKNRKRAIFYHRLHRKAYGICCVGLAVFAVLLDYLFYPWNAPLPAIEKTIPGENGLWLHYSWYFGQHSPAEIEQLRRSLTQRDISYAYFHVRYIGKSGMLRYRNRDAARRLNQILHRSAPNVKSIAWIYVGNMRGSGGIPDLSDTALRRRMVAEARFLVSDCGFDGVQWDYEICPDNDTGLLALLTETRAVLPRGKTLSVATALLEPSLPCRFGYGWSPAYFGKIAQRCDQMAIMGYDSGLYLPRAYVRVIADQVTGVCPIVARANPRCRVLIGVPTYNAGGLSHQAHAENLANAIRGVQEGYVHLSAAIRVSVAGIALFADYTTDADEWRLYHQEWQEAAR